jgi:arylsulfatase A-like enzyme
MAVQLTRRDALRAMAASGLALTVGQAVSAPAAGERPNILFILTDDQRWDALSCMGHPFLKTPNLDRIRHEGALFANAFVTTSLCSPSRGSFLTGCYAHTHGVMQNEKRDFDFAATPSFAQVLQKSGYHTGYVGKWHMGPKAGPRPGFDYWLSFRGQGKYTDPPLNENGRDFKAKGYMSDLLTDYALKFLGNSGGDKPFCLYLSHKAVHGPFTPAPRHADIWPEVQLKEPANYRDTFASKPEWMQSIHGTKSARVVNNRSTAGGEARPIPPWTPRKKATLDYYRAIQAVDDGVGKVLALLKEQGRLDNTVIVFAGDNGYFWGEHRRGDKRLMYEESLRIPMLIRYPELVKPGSTIKQMALNIDLAPTLLELAGQPVPVHMQGRSWRPLFAGRKAGWRKSFLYEYWVDLTPNIPRMVGVRTADWKLVRYPDLKDLDELYDLRSDPHELSNLAEVAAHDAKHQELSKELDRLLDETGYHTTKWKTQPLGRPQRGGKTVLAYDFAKATGDRVPDTSGMRNAGRIVVGTLVAGRVGGQALKLSGKGHVDVKPSPSLALTNRYWTYEAWIKAEADGVVVARGGHNLGLVLFLEGGKPSFSVRSQGRSFVAQGGESMLGKWTHIAGVFDRNQARVYVDGKLAGQVALPFRTLRDPKEPMQIGADLTTPVDPVAGEGRFRGLIDMVRVHSKALPADEIRNSAAR